ncbi:Oidioi.mRNA.OKI2018_I69.XSR.g15054.t1.cds [Oikopleura dioica]|nr:Oidioi.mRNA.OKI2018_I69.XSR.g15054.t1.cds [Oikopleura dioica]
MDENNRLSHLKGKKHNLRKVFTSFDFKTLVKRDDGSPTVALLLEHVFNAGVQSELPLYGVEFFVECHDPEVPNKMVIFHKASGSQFSLPLFEQSEEGEVSSKAEHALSKKYEKFLEDLWASPLISNSLRQKDFQTFKNASGWPWIETAEDGPHDTWPAWRRLQIQDGNKKVKEAAFKIAKKTDLAEFRGALNGIQIVGAEELEILKLETEKKLADFMQETIDEQKKPEVAKLCRTIQAKYREEADALATKVKLKAMKGIEQIPGVSAQILQKQREREKREAEMRRKNGGHNNQMAKNIRTLAPGMSGAIRPPAPLSRWPTQPNNFGNNNFQQQQNNAGNFNNNAGNNFQMRNGQQNARFAGPSSQMQSAEPMAELPPPPGLNIDLEEAAKNLTKMGEKLSGGQEKTESKALETKEMKLLRGLLDVERELEEKIKELKELADREKTLKEKDHKPIGKLLTVLESAKTAIASDYYLLFTKAHLKYRPRTIKIEANASESFGFRVQQTRVGGKRIFYFSSVTDRSPSAKAGLCQGDRLVELNDKVIDEYDYDELIEKIQTASKPNKEGKKSLVFLLSDPETDEYIQTELALPVIRFQVKPHVNPESIANEWLKFRKKQKAAKKGFFTDSSCFETKLEEIKPPVSESPALPLQNPAQEISDKISPTPTRDNEVDDLSALNYDRGGERRPLSRLITDGRSGVPPRREGWLDESPVHGPSPAHRWNDPSYRPNSFPSSDQNAFNNGSRHNYEPGWHDPQRHRHRSSEWNQVDNQSRFPANDGRWNGPPHSARPPPYQVPSGRDSRDFDSRQSHNPDYDRRNHEYDQAHHSESRPESWYQNDEDRRRPPNSNSRFRPY